MPGLAEPLYIALYISAKVETIRKNIEARTYHQEQEAVGMMYIQ